MQTIKAKVVVLGSGPGGYTAAFRAADLLKEGIVLVEQYEALGGVCLNVGCIPSKYYLHLAQMQDEIPHLADLGVGYTANKIDIQKMREGKQKIVNRLSSGIAQLAKMRKVTVVNGKGILTGPNTMVVEGKEKVTIEFEYAILAPGSVPVRLPFLPEDDRIITSTGALEPKEIPATMLIIGGGIIGMEMATVYSALGTKVTVVELTDGLLAGVDPDVVKPLLKRVSSKMELLFKTKVTKVEAGKSLMVTFNQDDKDLAPRAFDKILCAVGRTPNGKKIGAETAGVNVDERGFIPVDNQCRTNIPHIFAIGDVVGNPMLAHKSIPQGRVAAEVIAGKKHVFAPACIPSVAYTNPEVAWVGVTEQQAKAENLDYGKGVFPWAALGRALCLGREEGFTKILFDKQTHKVIGGAIVGVNAGDLIGEIAVAIEMGCEAEDLALTIHPHPTLGETIPLACEVYEGTVTDLPNK